MPTQRFVPLLFAVSLVASGVAQATLVDYLDRSSWSSAVGAPSGSENFNWLPADTEFRTQTLALNGMRVAADTTLHHGLLANKVDKAPFEFAGVFAVDGSAYLLADIELEFSPASDVQLRIDFVDPVTAWGADLTSFPTASITLVEVFVPNPADAALATFPFVAVTDETDFFGFEVTAGLPADHITFTIGGVSGFETVGIDNIEFAGPVLLIPAMGALGLLATAGCFMVASLLTRRREADRPSLFARYGCDDQCPGQPAFISKKQSLLPSRSRT